MHTLTSVPCSDSGKNTTDQARLSRHRRPTPPDAELALLGFFLGNDPSVIVKQGRVVVA